MTVARYALVDADRTVANVIVWDGVLYDPENAPRGWTPPDDLNPVLLDDDARVEVGDTIDEKGNITRTVPAPAVTPAPTLEELAARLATLEARSDPLAQQKDAL